MDPLAQSNKEKIELLIKCQNLADADFFGKSDPRATICQKDSKDGKYYSIGHTEVKKDDLNPNFANPIHVDFVFQSQQAFRVVVEDAHDKDFREIGFADFDMSQIMGESDMTLSLRLFNSSKKEVGKCTITAERPRPTSESYSYTIDLKCEKIVNLEWFSKSDPFLRIYRPKPNQVSQTDGNCIPESDWTKVHETEWKKDELNPDFAPFTISSGKLCRGNEDLPVKLEIWDYSKEGEKEFRKVGKGYFTVSSLARGIKEIPTFDDNKKSTGTIVVEKFDREQTYDLMDYLKAGLSLNQVVVIDYTKSNGNPKDPKSMHYFDSNSDNQYETCIRNVGSILFQYDKDEQIPVYGMGAAMPVIQVNDSKDFFFLQTDELAYASSIEDVLKLYESAFEYIDLGGPCRLGPCIKSTSEWVRSISQKEKMFYSVLLILTDGEVADMDVTLANIVDASCLPMSILIVGLGNLKFDDLKILDGDSKIPKDKKGRSPVRDIVQFVQYRPNMSKLELSEELLAELPHQIVEYFRMKKIAPCAN